MRNVIDSELKIIYIYRGVKFFTKKEAEKFKKIIDKRESTDQKVETLKIKKDDRLIPTFSLNTYIISKKVIR